MSTAVEAKVTLEEFLAMRDRGRYELVDGDLVEVNVSVLSSLVSADVVIKLGGYCKAHNLGLVWGADNLVHCFPDEGKYRKPDASFVRLDRVPWDRLEDGYLDLAPDLVVEVVSPNDLFYEVELKIQEYLAAGVRLVWVIVPETRTVRIFRADQSTGGRSANDDLEGEDVIPGFRCRVADLFPAIPKPAAPMPGPGTTP